MCELQCKHAGQRVKVWSGSAYQTQSSGAVLELVQSLGLGVTIIWSFFTKIMTTEVFF